MSICPRLFVKMWNSMITHSAGVFVALLRRLLWIDALWRKFVKWGSQLLIIPMLNITITFSEFPKFPIFMCTLKCTCKLLFVSGVCFRWVTVADASTCSACNCTPSMLLGALVIWQKVYYTWRKILPREQNHRMCQAHLVDIFSAGTLLQGPQGARELPYQVVAAARGDMRIAPPSHHRPIFSSVASQTGQFKTQVSWGYQNIRLPKS